VFAHSVQRLTPVNGVARVAEVGLEEGAVRVLAHHHRDRVDDRLDVVSRPDAKLHGHEMCVDEGLVVQEQAPWHQLAKNVAHGDWAAHPHPPLRNTTRLAPAIRS
jgi:hypothetical protein